jgi:hypothetical protein
MQGGDASGVHDACARTEASPVPPRATQVVKDTPAAGPTATTTAALPPPRVRQQQGVMQGWEPRVAHGLHGVGDVPVVPRVSSPHKDIPEQGVRGAVGGIGCIGPRQQAPIQGVGAAQGRTSTGSGAAPGSGQGAVDGGPWLVAARACACCLAPLTGCQPRQLLRHPTFIPPHTQSHHKVAANTSVATNSTRACSDHCQFRAHISVSVSLVPPMQQAQDDGSKKRTNLNMHTGAGMVALAAAREPMVLAAWGPTMANTGVGAACRAC